MKFSQKIVYQTKTKFCIKIFPCLCLYGVRLELTDWARIPLLIILMEVESGVPEGGVHVDVLLHGLEDRVGGGVPVEVPEQVQGGGGIGVELPLLLVDLRQLLNCLGHHCVQPDGMVSTKIFCFGKKKR